jgi:hypothetical protein
MDMEKQGFLTDEIRLRETLRGDKTEVTQEAEKSTIL